MFPKYQYHSPLGLVHFFPLSTEKSGNSIFSTTTLSYSKEQLGTVSPSTISSSVVQIVVKKQVNGFGVNSFQITLVDQQDEDGRTWLDKIYPNDLVSIYMCRPGVDGRDPLPVMLGVVRSISKVTNLSGTVDSPSVERQIIVSGMELVGLTASHYIFGNSSLLPPIIKLKDNYFPELKSLFKFLNEVFAQNIVSPVHNILEKYFEEIFKPDLEMINIPYNGQKLTQYLVFDSSQGSFKINDELKIFGLNYTMYSGSGAQFIDQVLQKPFNEIVTRYSLTQMDRLIPKCRVVVRPSPFKYEVTSTKNFVTHGYDLPKGAGMVDVRKLENHVHLVRDVDVITENIGRKSDFEHNIFIVAPATPEAVGVSLELNIEPVADTEHIKRHGINPIIVNLDYFNSAQAIEDASKKGGENATVKFSYAEITLANNLANVLKQWYIKSCEFLSGSMQIRGSASISEGDALIYETADYGGKNGKRYFLFYVDTVAHVFINFETFITNLELSRGVEIKEEEASGLLR